MKSKLPLIDAADNKLSRVSKKAWEAIKAANEPPRLFSYGDVPSRLERNDNGALVVRQLTQDRLRYETARAAEWYVVGDKGGEKPAKPPMDVIRDMLAAPNPPLPVLSRITEVPVFAPDGTLQTEPGYHPAAKVYYAPPSGLTIGKVPNSPTPNDIIQAKRLIFEHLLEGFPFVETADRAHALALMLLPYARDLISGPTPLHLIESPRAGTGKGLLSDVCLRPALGPRIGTLTQTDSEGETRKQITSALMQGSGAVIIDNIRDSLNSRALASALTALHWQDRILGKSEIVTLPVRCVWVTSGNNPAMSTEIARRTIRIRLDAQCSRPWERVNFKHPNLREFADEHRAALVRAGLILIQAWVAAGQLLWQSKTLGSYEQWAMTMGGVLEVAGIEGFLENLDDFYGATDVEGSHWEQLVSAWWRKFRQKSVGARELFPLALESGIELSGDTEHAQRGSFGKALTKRRDQVIDRFKIIRTGQMQRAMLWTLEPTHLKKVIQVDTTSERGASLNPDNFLNDAAVRVE